MAHPDSAKAVRLYPDKDVLGRSAGHDLYYPEPPKGSGEIVSVGNVIVMTDGAAGRFWDMYFNSEGTREDDNPAGCFRDDDK